MAGNTNLPTENIDEVILRLLALEPNEIDDISYEIYSQYLRELLVEITSNKRKIDSGEAELVQKEFKRVRSKKGRFKLKSKKSKVSASSFGVGRVRKQLKQTQQRFLLVGTATSVPDSKGDKVSKNKKDPDILERINDRLGSILKTLIDISKEDKKLRERERKEEENKRRQSKERGLEAKVFDGIKSTISKVMKPFQSIFDWILNFFTNVFLGKVVMKLLGWFSDPKNSDKIKSLIKFFTDWWPTMLGAYLLFGTSFGKLTRTLVGFAGKSVIGLGKVIYRLIAAIAKGKSLKVAGSFAGGRKGLGGGGGGGGWRGALLRGGLAVGGSLLAGAAIDKGVESFTGGGEEEQQAKVDIPDSPKIPMLNAATGGLADIGKIFGKFGGNMMGGAMGGMFGPLGMLMGSMMGGNLPNIFQGLVKGKKGTDKIPAMLTDGEFVMSKGAVQKYGVDTLEAMNAAGGGTNVPKIVKGVPHAVGGGYISRDFNGNMEGINPYDPKQMSEESFRKFVDQRIDERIYSKPLKLPQLNTPNMGVPPRSPIPASRAIVPYRGGGLVPYQSGGLIRSGVTAGLSESIPQIRTNMNVPGGRGGRGGIVGAISLTLAELFKPQIQSAVGKLYNKMGVGLGDLSDAELNKQIQEELKIQNSTISNIGPLLGGHVNSLGNDRLSLLQQELERRSPTLKGGKIVGGHKLQQESFRNAPKTMVMTDDKGRPFVGHKAMKNGKLTYVRPPKPGTGTTNPLEALGRMINPGAYKENDQRVAMKNQKIAMVNALESFQKRGMAPDAQARMMKQMGGNLKDVQNDLNARRARLSEAKSKQAGAAAIGRYYSSSDGKYYANYAAAEKARDARRAKLASQQRTRTGVRPPTKPSPTSRSTYRGGQRSSGANPSTGPGSTRPVSPTRRGSTSQTARQLGVNPKR